MEKLTRAELIKVLKYDPKTGLFHWKKPNAPRMKKMDIAGCKTPDGRIQIIVERKAYFGHTLAYLFKKKRWPEYEIYHKNGNKSDNRWNNLELADYKNFEGEITQKKLKEFLYYNPETGDFFWNKTISNSRGRGKRAGSWSKSDGYLYITVFKHRTTAQRWAWFYMEGFWPEHEIDHINRDPSDNRWINLRHITHKCNSRNTKTRVDNNTGVPGVFKHKMGYMVRLKREYIGFFMDLAEAVKARWQAEKAHGYANCQTTSSAYKYLKDNDLMQEEGEKFRCRS